MKVGILYLIKMTSIEDAKLKVEQWKKTVEEKTKKEGKDIGKIIDRSSDIHKILEYVEKAIISGNATFDINPCNFKCNAFEIGVIAQELGLQVHGTYLDTLLYTFSI
jgi:hypothetical protein